MLAALQLLTFHQRSTVTQQFALAALKEFLKDEVDYSTSFPYVPVENIQREHQSQQLLTAVATFTS